MNKVKKIGVVVAIEIDAVLEKYGTPSETYINRGFTVRSYVNDAFTMYVVDSGAGEIASSAATQLLISEYKVDMIVNFGAVGALTERMKSAELCVVEKVIHYDFDTTGWLNLPRGQHPEQESAYVCTTPELVSEAMRLSPGLLKVVCCSADKFIDAAEDKSFLNKTYGGDICEMEAAGVVLTCSRNDVPCLLIKAVADSLFGGGREFLTELNRVSQICFELVDRLVRQMIQ